MPDREFFTSKLGRAAIASVGTMFIFVAMSTQMQLHAETPINANVMIATMA